jgi:hypothetical protein
LTGTLDCAGQKLVGGALNCTYEALGFHVKCSGTIDANYDFASSSFVAGAWNVSESGAVNDAGTYGIFDYGGTGTWTATADNGGAGAAPDSGAASDSGAAGDSGAVD